MFFYILLYCLKVVDFIWSKYCIKSLETLVLGLCVADTARIVFVMGALIYQWFPCNQTARERFIIQAIISSACYFFAIIRQSCLFYLVFPLYHFKASSCYSFHIGAY